MYLKKLEINGFKSFAKKTTLTFEPGITSIVGPNGSGKSNIADALRWCFGEQSMKTLRGRKSEDVIFAGSDQKSRSSLAEAFVYFDNSDRKMDIDYGEVVIGRRFYRDGTSEYLINENKVRLMDIQDLLSKSGFGNSSYHVIGQGMIDQLILGGPGAIKDLIEEAAGIRPYYIKRERALKRLLSTETNLEQVKALMKEIKPRLRSLERQTKRLEKREELEKQLHEAEALYFGNLFLELQKEGKEIDDQLREYDRQIGELGTEIEKLSLEIDEEEKKTLKTADQQSEKKLSLEKLRKEKQDFLEKRAVLKGELALIRDQKVDVQVDLPTIKQKLHKVYEKLVNFFSGLDSFSGREERDQQIKSLEQDFQTVLREFEDGSDNRKEKIQAAEQQVAKLDEKLEKLSEQIEQKEKELFQEANAEGGARKKLFEKERLLRNKQDNLLRTRDQKNNVAVQQARLQTREENYIDEAKEALGTDYKDKLVRPDGPLPSGLAEKIQRLRKEIAAIGGIDDLTMQEYRETSQRFEYLDKESKDLIKASSDLEQIIIELDEVIKKDFNKALSDIGDKFGEYFRILFGGGKAVLNPVRKKLDDEDKDLEDEIEEELIHKSQKTEIVGVQINATPPGKKLSGIAALSGGERALTSIALLSAMLACFPSPFVVLDEVDAALDEANSIRFGKILSTLSDNTQFITITHNRETMRQSHTLYGITMGEDGVSRLLSLKLDEAAAYSSKN